MSCSRSDSCAAWIVVFAPSFGPGRKRRFRVVYPDTSGSIDAVGRGLPRSRTIQNPIRYEALSGDFLPKILKEFY